MFANGQICTYFGANYFRVVFGAEAKNASQRSLAAFEASGQGSPFQVVPFAVFLTKDKVTMHLFQWVAAAEHITVLSPHLHYPAQACGRPAPG